MPPSGPATCGPPRPLPAASSRRPRWRCWRWASSAGCARCRWAWPRRRPAGPLARIARTPRFIIAAAAGVVSFGLMSLVMTAAPLAMVDCGHSVAAAALGIQWHVLAMYAPSFVTGRLIERFGKLPVTALGLALMLAAAGVSLIGLSVPHFWAVLVLLGVGWNLGFIGATAMLADCCEPHERLRVQALNDLLVFGCVAAASFSSGQLLAHGGWSMVNLTVLPAAAAVLLLLAWQGRKARG
ncbi:transporter, major facilitator domain protein [Bordetella bronchiseptica 00-P-2730]|nr:transporter, major facilitator domain protein [Bordetella bronchiseptica 00-P-2730]